MKKFTALLAALILFSSCAQLGTWYNSPSGKAEVALAEQIALQFFETWITTIGVARRATPLKSASAQTFMTQAEATIHAKCPDLPPAIIHAIVVTRFVGQ